MSSRTVVPRQVRLEFVTYLGIDGSGGETLLHRMNIDPAARAGLTIREARLRPEATERYPGVAVGKWLPASQVASQCQSGTAAEPSSVAAGRVLAEEAFEFRGGAPEISLRRRARTRWADHPGPVTASRRAVRPF
jgi:hypothetical protein